MTISVKQYARGLGEAAADKTQAEQTELVGRFLRLLKVQGKLALADKIAAELKSIILETNGIVPVEVKSARQLSTASLSELSRLIKDKTGCREVRLEVKLAPELLGGAVIKYQDKIINFSLQYFLSKMKQALIK
jgi:F-type H+-transporting ATPase subunit delta